MPLPVSFLPHRGAGAAVLFACIGSLCAAAVLAATTDFDAERKRCEAEQQSVKVVCLRELKAAMTAASASPATSATAAASAPTASAQTLTAASGSAGQSAPAGTSASAAPSSSGLYKVVDGDKVDPGTLEGFRTWRAAACSRCHGANQEGLVGPSLINSLKTLSKQDFVTTVTNGRLEKGMPSFKESKMVMENIDHLYAYLKGRSDGAITAAHVYPMK